MAHEIVAVLEPVKADAHWHEVFVEIAEPGSDLDDDDSDDGPADERSVCGGPGALRECLLGSSAGLRVTSTLPIRVCAFGSHDRRSALRIGRVCERFSL